MSQYFRYIAAWCYAVYLIVSGRLRSVFEKSDNNEIIISVYFHNPSKKLFEKAVLFFLKNKYKFISADELVDILSQKKSFPGRSVIFTVDDGWKENENNIILVAEKYQIPVTIFLATDPIEKRESFWWSIAHKAFKKKLTTFNVQEMKAMDNLKRKSIIDDLKSDMTITEEALTVEQIKSRKNSLHVKFGAHTMSHPILTKCDDQISHTEIRESAAKIKSWVNYPISSFAYPNGNYTIREIEYLKSSGYRIAFTTNPAYITKDQSNHLFEIPRFDVLESVSFAENICRMTGIWFEKNNKK
jgi:peptidoglycan/xylan/chitin deacetylase (PgdA/CDA1 family)